MAKQLSLLKCDNQYGGDHSAGKAKIRRPLSTRKPLHVTLRSSRAIGKFSLLVHRKKIQSVMNVQASRWHVQVYRHSINGNHIHLAMRGKSRVGIQNFFRSFAGLVARLVTKAERANPFGKFWDRTIWSRVAEWGQAFTALKSYVVRNIYKSAGLVPYNRSISTKEILRV